MPKLLRLAQTEAALAQAGNMAVWESYLHDGIPLGRHARIGLKGLVVPMARRLLIVAGVNDRLSLKCRAGAAYPAFAVVVPPNPYLLADLLVALQNAIVEQLAPLGADNSRIGIQMMFSPGTAGGGRLQFAYARAADTAAGSIAAQNVALAANVYTAGPAAPAAGDTYICSGQYLLKGCSYVRTALGVMGETRLGITSQFAAAGLPDALLDYYVRAADDGGGGFLVAYWDADAGAEVVTAADDVQTTDVLEICIVNRLVRYSCYQANGVEKWHWTHADTRWDLGTNYRPAVVFSEIGASAGVPRLIADPNFSEDGDYIVALPPGADLRAEPLAGAPAAGLGVFPMPPGVATVTTLAWPGVAGEGLREVLGMPGTWVSPQRGTGSVQGVAAVNSLVTARGVFVELSGLPMLASWDAAIFRRRPILATVPAKFSDASYVLTYDAPHPVMLSMDNPQPLLLRTLIVRIFMNGPGGVDTLCECDDPCQLTVILDDDERAA